MKELLETIADLQAALVNISNCKIKDAKDLLNIIPEIVVIGAQVRGTLHSVWRPAEMSMCSMAIDHGEHMHVAQPMSARCCSAHNIHGICASSTRPVCCRLFKQFDQLLCCRALASLH